MAFLTFHLQLAYTEKNHSWQRQRQQLAVQHLEAQSNTLDQIIPIIGSSEIESGINPLLIDQSQQSNKMKVYNFGFRDLTVKQVFFIALKLKTISEKANKKFPLIVFDVPANMLTETVNKNIKVKLNDDIILSYVDTEFLLNSNDISQSEKIRLLAKKLFFLNRDLNLIGPMSKNFLSELFDFSSSIEKSMSYFWYSPEIHRWPAWNPDQNGYFNHQADQSNSFLVAEAELRSNEGREKTKHFLNENTDATGLDFHEESVLLLQRALKLMNQSTERLVLTQLPYNPDLNISSFKNKEIFNLVQTLKPNESAPVYFLTQYHSVSSSDYIDSVHFWDKGLLKMNSFFNLVLNENWPR